MSTHLKSFRSSELKKGLILGLYTRAWAQSPSSQFCLQVGTELRLNFKLSLI